MPRKLKINYSILLSDDLKIKITCLLLSYLFANVQNAEILVAFGQTAVLPCIVDIIGNVQVIWLNSGLDIVSFNEEIRIPDGRYSLQRHYQREWNLRIVNTVLSDSGIYTCQVTIGKDVYKNEVELVFLIAPTAKLDSAYLEIMEDKELSLQCKTSGYPTPKIEWHFYMYNESKRIIMSAENDGSLKRKNLKAEDGGKYVCVASNEVPPVASQSCYVNILLPPRVTTQYIRLTQRHGLEVNIACSVNANPLPTVSWHFKSSADQNFSPLSDQIIPSSDSSTQGHIETIYNGGKSGYWNMFSVFIRNVTFNDAGFYRCDATNDFGNASEQIELTVQEQNFEIVNKPTDTTVFIGSRTIIYCTLKFNGYENKSLTKSVNVSWYRKTPKGLEILFNSAKKDPTPNKRIRIVDEFNLEVSSLVLSDEGLYTCQVSSYGSDYYFTMFLSIIKQYPTQENAEGLSTLNLVLIICLVLTIFCSTAIILYLLHRLGRIKFINKCLK